MSRQDIFHETFELFDIFDIDFTTLLLGVNDKPSRVVRVVPILN